MTFSGHQALERVKLLLLNDLGIVVSFLFNKYLANSSQLIDFDPPDIPTLTFIHPNGFGMISGK